MIRAFTPGARAPFRAPEGVDGGGGEAAVSAGATDADAAATAAAAASWHADTRLTDDHRAFLTAKGVTAATDPMDAITRLIGMGQAADKRFGKGIDAVMDKPAQDQALAEWRRAHADVFGLPKDPDGYEITRPEGFADGAAWSDDLTGRMRQLAFERGLAPDDVQAMTDMYAGYVGEVNAGMDREMQAAEARLKAELGTLWGRDAEANTARARQAAGALAEAAGLDQDGVAAVVGLLSGGQPGETLALRMFAALGTMMGEDRAVGIGHGTGSLGMSKSEAQQAWGAFTAPDGPWAQAAKANDGEAIARLRPTYERLSRQLAGAK